MITIRKRQSAPHLWSGSPGISAISVEVTDTWTETWIDGSKVMLNWTAPFAFDTSTATYQIYKAGQFFVSVPGSVTSYEDMNIASGTTYTYTVYLMYRP